MDLPDRRLPAPCRGPWIRLREDDDGAVIVLVAALLFALVGLMTLTIDLGKQLRAAAQAQAAADAAALAGAGGFVRAPGDRALARRLAAEFAAENEVMDEPVTLAEEDVTVPGEDSIRVRVRRTADAPDGRIATIFGSALGMDSLEVIREATARAVPAGTSTCALPLGIVDQFRDVDDDSTFTLGTDVYDPSSSDPRANGYRASEEFGEPIEIFLDEQTGTIVPGWWGPWSPEGSASRGTNELTNAIVDTDCDTTDDRAIGVGQTIETETGQRAHPIQQAIEDLIQHDPNVRWDSSCNDGKGCVVDGTGDVVNDSPRLRPLPVYSPKELVDIGSGKKPVEARNLIGVFIQDVDDSNPGGDIIVHARLVFAPGTLTGGGNADDSFLRAVQLVE